MTALVEHREWTADRAQLVAHRIGYHLMDSSQQGNPIAPTIEDLATALGESVDVVRQAAMVLDQDSIVKLQHSLVGLRGMLITDHGIGVMQSRRARAQEVKLRRVACREALLDWAYASEGILPRRTLTDFHRDSRSFINGDPFTEAEVQNAAAYLSDAGLVEPISVDQGIVLITILHEGKVCVEDYDGNIGRHKSARGSSAHFSLTGTNINLAHGSSGTRQEIHSPAAVESPNIAPPVSESRYSARMALFTAVIVAVVGAAAVIVAAIISSQGQ